MKINFSGKHNRLLPLVWGFVWLNFVTQYWFYAPPLEALLAPTLFVLAASPLTNYLSGPLLNRAISTRKWGLFSIQFTGMALAFGVVLHGLIYVFAQLEVMGVFPDSDLFSEMGAPVHELVNVFLSALIINFGFCGLRFLENNIRLQKELHESQLQTLNGQINPHSMFNILNHVHVLLQNNPQAADELLLLYSSTLRYQLYNANKDKVNIKQEVDFLKQYVEVEKVRWMNKLTVLENWSIDNENQKIPPLLFISFLENAFKHVSRSDSEKGHVKIFFNQSDREITFGVENSKSCFKTDEKKEGGLGLPNIRKRLDILFPQRHELIITESDDFYSILLTLTI